MAALARLVPERVVPVRAAADGFLLTPDQGEVFSETAGGGPLAPGLRSRGGARRRHRELGPPGARGRPPPAGAGAAPWRAGHAGNDPAPARGVGRLPG